MKLLKSPSFYALIFSCLFLLRVSFFIHHWSQPNYSPLIGYDQCGYYMYLPTVFYDQLGEHKKYDYIVQNYHPNGAGLDVKKSPKGKMVIKYTGGMAILYLPGFLAGHCWAKYGGYAVDGFSYPYQVSMAMYSLLVSFLGLWFMRKNLLRYFSEGIVALALILLCTGTNYLNFSATGGMFSHNYLLTIYAIIIYVTELWYLKPDYKKSIALGLLCGIAALCRPTEVICVILPLLWGVADYRGLKERLKNLSRNYRLVMVFTLCAIAVGSIQLIYWKKYAGSFLYWSYNDYEHLNMLRVYVAQCLFSYKKGWFVYTPVMILAILGFIPLYINKRNIFWAALIFCFMALWLTFSWSCWWYGGSFSMRAVVEFYAVFLFPFCAFLSVAFKRISTGLLITPFLIFCTWLNLLMIYQANVSYIMESDDMSRAYFWRIFGRTWADRMERKFIDTDEDVPEKLQTSLVTIFNSDTLKAGEDDTIIAGKQARRLHGQLRVLLEKVDLTGKKSGWMRVWADVYCGDGAVLNSTAIVAKAMNDKGEIKRKSYVIGRVEDGNEWKTINVDIHLPDEKATILYGGIEQYNGKAPVYVGKIRIEYTPLDN